MTVDEYEMGATTARMERDSLIATMTREELHTHHGKKVSITYGGGPGTGLLDAHDVTKACLKNLLKDGDDTARSDAHSVVYLTDQDIASMTESGETLIQSRISIPCTDPVTA